VIEEGDRVAQVAGRGFAESQRPDVQLVDDEIGEARGNRLARRELRRPELLGRYEVRLRSGRRGREPAAHDIGIDHHAAADGAVQSVDGTRPVARDGVDRAFPDLAPGKDVGAIDRLPLRVHDAIHVRKASEHVETALRAAFPDAATRWHERNHGLRRVDPRAIVGNVAACRVAEHHLDVARVGRPYGELQARHRAAWRGVFVRAEPPPAGEVVPFDLRRAAGQSKLPVALDGIDVLHFRRNAPEVTALRAVEDDAPLERSLLVGEVERD
jgi:hypothetical protein